MKKTLLTLALLGVLQVIADPERPASDDDITKQPRAKQEAILYQKAHEEEQWLRRAGEQNHYYLESLIELGWALGALGMLKYLPVAAEVVAAAKPNEGKPDVVVAAKAGNKARNIGTYVIGSLALSTMIWALYKLYRDHSSDSCYRDKLEKLDERYRFLQQHIEYISGLQIEPAA